MGPRAWGPLAHATCKHASQFQCRRCATDSPRSTIGLEAAVATISKAVQAALDSHQETQGQPFQTLAFSRVWVGMAGYDRASLKPLIDSALSELFTLPLGNGLTVSSDIDILPAALSSKPDIPSAIVLIAGTGSISMSYTRQGHAHPFRRTARVGGWGRLIGDDGSGYAIGRSAIRRTLRTCDLHRMKKAIGAEPAPFTPLTQAVLDHFRRRHPGCTPESFLDTLLIPDASTHGAQNADVAVTRSIASAAEVVLSMAGDGDAEAGAIVDAAAESVADLVALLAEGQDIKLASSAVVLGGGLMGHETYKAKVLGGIESKCGGIAHVELVQEPALVGAQSLLGRAAS